MKLVRELHFPDHTTAYKHSHNGLYSLKFTHLDMFTAIRHLSTSVHNHKHTLPGTWMQVSHYSSWKFIEEQQQHLSTASRYFSSFFAPILSISFPKNHAPLTILSEYLDLKEVFSKAKVIALPVPLASGPSSPGQISSVHILTCCIQVILCHLYVKMEKLHQKIISFLGLIFSPNKVFTDQLTNWPINPKIHPGLQLCSSSLNITQQSVHRTSGSCRTLCVSRALSLSLMCWPALWRNCDLSISPSSCEVDRANQKIVQVLRTICTDNLANQAQFLPWVECSQIRPVTKPHKSLHSSLCLCTSLCYSLGILVLTHWPWTTGFGRANRSGKTHINVSSRQPKLTRQSLARSPTISRETGCLACQQRCPKSSNF